jgi:hypothetical protein
VKCSYNRILCQSPNTICIHIMCSFTNKQKIQKISIHKQKKEREMCLSMNITEFFYLSSILQWQCWLLQQMKLRQCELEIYLKKNKSTHSTTITMNWLLKYSLYQIKNKENWNYFFCLWLELHEECELFVDVVYLFLHFLNCFWNDNISNFIKQFDQFICFVLFV